MKVVMENFSSNNLPDLTSQENSSCSAEIFEFKLAKYAFYGVIFLISFIGNSFVCWVVWRKAGMKTVINYFLVNLAAADLAFTVICIPFDLPVQENSYKWPFHESLCKVIFPLQTMCAFASVFTLAAISLSRFRAVVYPMKRQLNLQATRLVICLIWLSSLVFVVPYGLVLRVNTETKQCAEDWPAPAYLYRRSYTISILIVQYLIPLVLIFWAYVKIYLEMTASSARYPLRDEHALETRKVLRTAIAATVVFAICMLPNHIAWLFIDFIESSRTVDCSSWLVAANICVFANSAADPIIYTVFHEKYRKEFVTFASRIFNFCKGKERNRNLVVTVTYYGNPLNGNQRYSGNNKLDLTTNTSTNSIVYDTTNENDNHHRRHHHHHHHHHQLHRHHLHPEGNKLELTTNRIT